jgi:hypothetical protein
VALTANVRAPLVPLDRDRDRDLEDASPIERRDHLREEA